MHVTGFIQDKSPDGKRIKMDDGKWYGAFTSTMIGTCGPGDSVSFDYKDSAKLDQNGNPYRNIVGKVFPTTGVAARPAPMGAPTTTPMPARIEKVGEPILSNSRCIIRQNALTNAVNYHKALMEFCMDDPMKEEAKKHPERIVESILKAAELFEDYTSGDKDEEEAKRELGLED